jgi:hypothetical protein
MLEKFPGSRQLSSAPSCYADFTGEFGLTTKSTKFMSEHYSDLRIPRAFVVNFPFFVRLRLPRDGIFAVKSIEFPDTPSLQTQSLGGDSLE